MRILHFVFLGASRRVGHMGFLSTSASLLRPNTVIVGCGSLPKDLGWVSSRRAAAAVAFGLWDSRETAARYRLAHGPACPRSQNTPD